MSNYHKHVKRAEIQFGNKLNIHVSMFALLNAAVGVQGDFKIIFIVPKFNFNSFLRDG